MHDNGGSYIRRLFSAIFPGKYAGSNCIYRSVTECGVLSLYFSNCAGNLKSNDSIWVEKTKSEF